jgi:hypothetical protein
MHSGLKCVLSFMAPRNDSQLCLAVSVTKIFMKKLECYQYSVLLYIFRVTKHDPSKTLKANVKQSHYRPWQVLMVPGGLGSQILKQSAHEGGKDVNPRTGSLYSREIFLLLISFRGWVDPSTIVRSKGIYQWKIPVAPSEIGPATFRFVAQYLNHRATACPPSATSKTTTIKV